MRAAKRAKPALIDHAFPSPPPEAHRKAVDALASSVLGPFPTGPLPWFHILLLFEATGTIDAMANMATQNLRPPQASLERAERCFATISRLPPIPSKPFADTDEIVTLQTPLSGAG